MPNEPLQPTAAATTPAPCPRLWWAARRLNWNWAFDGEGGYCDMRQAALRVLGLLLVALAGGSLAGTPAQDKARPPEGTKSPAAAGRPQVVKERVGGDHRHPGETLLRITGKVKALDAGTLAFEDGTRVEVAGTMDAPALAQKGRIGDAFYPWGEEAAAFLRKLIGDRPVTFYSFGDGGDRDVRRLRGRCFVGETDLGAEMVRNGWALSAHSAMTPYEVIARENKRGVWRGTFVVPERWRKGERLPGE
jgi:endonuclease YncB( thermonuclease family)